MDPTLTLAHIRANRPALLADLKRRQAVLRDYVRGVARGYATGLYLFGRPGTAKTHTVKDVLDREVREPYAYRQGHLAPMGLFEHLADHLDEVSVLDDLGAVLDSPVSVQLLLAALARPKSADRARLVTYKRQGREERVAFRGGVVCVSNRELPDAEVLAAFKSRVNVLNYDPADAQLGAVMLAHADLGPDGVPPAEARAVAEHVIAELARLGCRSDLRLFFDKAVPLYQQWKDGEAESHWRDLVTATIEEHLVAVRHAGEDRRPPRREEMEADRAVVREILRAYPTRDERVEAWKERTGKSERAYYRRLAELQ